MPFAVLTRGGALPKKSPASTVGAAVLGVPVKVRSTVPPASRNSIFTSGASVFRK